MARRLRPQQSEPVHGALERPGSVEPPKRPDGVLVWLVSEDASRAGPGPAIAEELSRRTGEAVSILATTVRNEPLCPGVGEKSLHQLAPVETEADVTKFLSHWRPDFGVVIGTPNRPHLVGAAIRQGIPMFHAFAERRPEMAAKLPSYLAGFDTCLAPSAAVANVMKSQFKTGKMSIEISGPLSDTVFAMPANPSETDDMAALLGGRPVWLAAGIGPSEVSIVEAAHRKAFRSAHRLLLLLSPRSREDSDAIAGRLEEAQWTVARRSLDAEPTADVQVYLADEPGELGLWYRLAPVSFMGGTLHPDSTPTDPFAPAALGSAVLHGPFTGESPWRYQRLGEQNASVLVRNSQELGEAIITLLAPDKAASLAQAGWAVTTESAHVVERLAELMEERLVALEAAH